MIPGGSENTRSGKTLGSRHAAWEEYQHATLGVGFQVVEIAPAFGLDESMRQQLHSDAVRLVKHVGYRNAGALAPRPLLLMYP